MESPAPTVNEKALGASKTRTTVDPSLKPPISSPLDNDRAGEHFVSDFGTPCGTIKFLSLGELVSKSYDKDLKLDGKGNDGKNKYRIPGVR